MHITCTIYLLIKINDKTATVSLAPNWSLMPLETLEMSAKTKPKGMGAAVTQLLSKGSFNIRLGKKNQCISTS